MANTFESKSHRTLLWAFTLMIILLAGSGCLISSSTESNISPSSTDMPADTHLPQPTSPLTIPTLTPTEEITAEEETGERRQWAISAVDNESFDQEDYAIGEPDSEGCELSPRGSVWVYQPDYPSYPKYLQLFYSEPFLPSRVNIHLAYDHYDIVRVSLIDLIGNPHEIYNGLPTDLDECPYVLSIEVKNLNEPVYAVRIDLETVNEETFGLTAIDAVELVGTSLPEPLPTPIPTPYLTLSSLGFNAAEVPEGFVYFEVIDNNSGETLSSTECDVFSYNLTEEEQTIRFFSCNDQTEVELYHPLPLEIGSIPLNSYPLTPTAKLYYDGHYIPAMEGELWVDQIDEKTLTGVLEFKGFDPENQVDYYRLVAVFNKIPKNEETSRKPGDMIIQWAEDVEASSEISSAENSAAQAAGSSDTWENCSDAITAWKPDPEDAQPWIEFYFATPVQPVGLNILLTGNPEAVVAVNLLSETDFFPLDMSTARVLEGCPTALTFDPMETTTISIIGIQIILDASVLDASFGIDAVQMIGIIPD